MSASYCFCSNGVSSVPAPPNAAISKVYSTASANCSLFRCLGGQQRRPGANYLKFGKVVVAFSRTLSSLYHRKKYFKIAASKIYVISWLSAILFQRLCTVRRANTLFFCAPYSLWPLHWFVCFQKCIIQKLPGIVLFTVVQSPIFYKSCECLRSWPSGSEINILP